MSTLFFTIFYLTEKYKTTDVLVHLDQITWKNSSAGKYYAEIQLDTQIKNILAISLSDWGILRASDNVHPVIDSKQNMFSVMSNVKSYDSGAYIKVRVLYY